FDTEPQAIFARNMDYKLGKSATVEQQGNKFYLSHIQHADETAKGVREGLIVSENETPKNLINTFLSAITGGRSIRSSAYTVAPFQRNNRIVSTHAPSIMREAIEDAAKDIS
ncbi:hypothetical protein, partial [Staphylococcus aureus]